MAVEERVESTTLHASGDLSAHMYKFVKLDGSGNVILNTVLGGQITGVLYDKPTAADRACRVAIKGRIKVLLGATLAPGAAITSSAAGLAVAAASGQAVLGYLRDGGDANDIGSFERQSNAGLLP